MIMRCGILQQIVELWVPNLSISFCCIWPLIRRDKHNINKHPADGKNARNMYGSIKFNFVILIRNATRVIICHGLPIVVFYFCLGEVKRERAYIIIYDPTLTRRDQQVAISKRNPSPAKGQRGSSRTRLYRERYARTLTQRKYVVCTLTTNLILFRSAVERLGVKSNVWSVRYRLTELDRYF